MSTLLQKVKQPLVFPLSGEYQGVPKTVLFLDAVASGHIRFSEPLQLVGDFEISFLSQAVLGNPYVFVGSDDSDNNRITLTSDGRIITKLNSSYSVLGNIENFITDNDLKEFRIVRVNDAFYVYVNGILACKGGNTGIPTFTRIGSDDGITTGYSGALADFNVWVNGDRFSGDHIIRMPLDDKEFDVMWNRLYSLPANYYPELNAPYNTDSLSNFSATGNSSSFEIVDGKIKVTRIGTNSSWLIRAPKSYEKGVYFVDITFERLDEWSKPYFMAYAYSHTYSGPLGSHTKSVNGRARFIFKSDIDDHSISVIMYSDKYGEDIGKSFLIKEFSVRKLDHIVGVKQNIIDADYQTFYEKEPGYRKSAEIIKNGNFLLGQNNWTFSDGWTINNGKAKRDGDSANDGIEQLDVFTAGRSYEVAYETSGRTNGSLISYIGQGTQRIDDASQSALNTEHTYQVFSNHTAKLLLNGAVGFDGAVDKVSVKETLNGPFGQKDRYLTEFDAVAQSRVFLQNVTISGDFELEVKFTVNDFTTYNQVLGLGLFGLRIDTEDQGKRLRALLPKTGGSAYYRPIGTSDALEENTVYTAVIKRSGGTNFTTKINGIIDTFIFEDVEDTLNLTYIGTNSVGNWQHNGKIFDLKVWLNGDRTTGNLYLDMPLDEESSYSRYIKNNAAIPTDITYPPNAIAFENEGVYEVDGDTFTVRDVTNPSFGPTWDSLISENKYYLVTFDVLELQGKFMIQRWTEDWSGPIIGNDSGTSVGHYVFPVVGCGKFRLRVVSAGDYCKFGNVRIYEFDKPIGFSHNIIAEDRKLHLYEGYAGFIGPSIVNGLFNTQDNWVLGAGWTIENGNANHAGTSLGYIYQTNILSTGSDYIIRGRVKELTSGSLDLHVGSTGSIEANVDEVGYFTTKALTATGPSFYLRKTDPNASVVLEYLEVCPVLSLT
ncbi:hypothetical protein [Marisediminitalea sp.]|uniref:hypothetical protein n=1 Tax=Marisediminitalea sp. TaxID=2662268 RepID=UPI003513819D